MPGSSPSLGDLHEGGPTVDQNALRMMHEWTYEEALASGLVLEHDDDSVSPIADYGWVGKKGDGNYKVAPYCEFRYQDETFDLSNPADLDYALAKTGGLIHDTWAYGRIRIAIALGAHTYHLERAEKAGHDIAHILEIARQHELRAAFATLRTLTARAAFFAAAGLGTLVAYPMGAIGTLGIAQAVIASSYEDGNQNEADPKPETEKPEPTDDKNNAKKRFEDKWVVLKANQEIPNWVKGSDACKKSEIGDISKTAVAGLVFECNNGKLANGCVPKAKNKAKPELVELGDKKGKKPMTLKAPYTSENGVNEPLGPRAICRDIEEAQIALLITENK